MRAEETAGRSALTLTGLDLPPQVAQFLESLSGDLSLERRNDPLALDARHRRFAFHLGRPPDDHVRIAIALFSHHCRRLLVDDQRHERRGIPKSQRPPLRSSISASTAPAPLTGPGGGWASRRDGIGPRRFGGRTIPARTSRTRRASSGISSAGTSFATGLPRSRIRTVSPPRTRSRSALNVFFASEIEAVRI